MYLFNKKIFSSLSLAIFLISIYNCTHQIKIVKEEELFFPRKQELSPPVAKQKPDADTIYGDIYIDNYSWLEQRDDPEVIAYLKAENKYTEEMMEHTQDLQKKLFDETIGRIKETDLTVPYKIDNYWYYTRTEKGKQYPLYCRKKDNLNAKEEIILNHNKLAEGLNYCELGILKVSPDHNYLAYSIDTAGSERYTLHIKHLRNDTLLNEKIKNIGYSVQWANDNETVFYTVLDNTERPFKLYSHRLGTLQSDDKLIYKEKDPSFFVYIEKSKNKRFLFIETGSHITSEVYYLRSDNPDGNFKLFQERESNIEYYVESLKDKFIILTNENAENFKMVSAPITQPSKKNWKEIIPHRDSVKIDRFDIFRDYTVLYEREKGLQKIRIIQHNGEGDYYITFPEPVYALWRGNNPEFDSNTLRFQYSSLVTPRTVIDYNMETGEREVKKQYEVVGDYDKTNYKSERIFATAKDSTMIPISLVYKKNMVIDGTNPLILYGYGAYGSSYDTYFSSIRLSLLNRGFIYAIAHVRGGGELGKQWHEKGKLLNKKNTFNDFISCAQHLIDKKYTSKNKLIISGASAGGLLIGTVINKRPDLFKGAVAEVPFVDVFNTMLNPSLPLTVLEYDEWGNPGKKIYFNYIKSYSPYDNVKAQNYPHLLILANINDTRVAYWEAAKWTAKLRKLKTDNNILLLRTKMGAGHMGASGRYDLYKDIAFEYAFILSLFGIKE
jgi:oligopeptidase B